MLNYDLQNVVLHVSTVYYRRLPVGNMGTVTRMTGSVNVLQDGLELTVWYPVRSQPVS